MGEMDVGMVFVVIITGVWLSFIAFSSVCNREKSKKYAVCGSACAFVFIGLVIQDLYATRNFADDYRALIAMALVVVFAMAWSISDDIEEKRLGPIELRD